MHAHFFKNNTNNTLPFYYFNIWLNPSLTLCFNKVYILKKTERYNNIFKNLKMNFDDSI